MLSFVVKVCVDCVDVIKNSCRVCGDPYDVDDFQVMVMMTDLTIGCWLLAVCIIDCF